MEFNSIGYFQFNNLLQSRVPMTLLVLEKIDLKPWYNSIVQMHLETITIYCEGKEALQILSDKKAPKNFAVIVLDMNGKESQKVAKNLEAAGFINAYFVEGGFTLMAKEKNS